MIKYQKIRKRYNYRATADFSNGTHDISRWRRCYCCLVGVCLEALDLRKGFIATRAAAGQVTLPPASGSLLVGAQLKKLNTTWCRRRR